MQYEYIITYIGAPIIWKSQLQMEIALSSTESEYTSLLYALRKAIPLMHMLRKINNLGFNINNSALTISCRVFEDNSGALEIAKVYKYHPHTKYLNVKLHHFRKYVERENIMIKKIGTENQYANFLTKLVNKPTLVKLRKCVMGW